MAFKRDLIFVSGGRIVAAVMALIAMSAVTSYLSPEQYGELALLIAIQVFCGLILINPVGQHINLHTHAWWDRGTLLPRLKSFRLYVFAVSTVGGLLVLAIGQEYSVKQFLFTALSMFAMVTAATWNATLIHLLNMLGFRAESVLWSTISIIVSLLSSILLVLWLKSATAWFAGQMVGLTVGALGAKYVLQKYSKQPNHSQNRFSLLDKQIIISYCLPLALATGFMWLQLSGYRFVVEHYWGLTQLGLLAVGLQLAGQIFGLAESLAMQFLYPLFFRRVSDFENNAKVELALSDLINTLVPVYFLLTGLVVFSAQYLLKILVAPQFQDTIIFVMLGACIELCRVLANLLSNAAQVKRKTNSLAPAYAIGSFIGLVLICYAGVRHMDIIWACVALTIGVIAMFVTMLINMYSQVKFTLDIKRFVASVLTMLIMVSFVSFTPKVTDLTEAIGMMLLSILLMGVSIFALLWQNPSTLRLLNVQLRNR